MILDKSTNNHHSARLYYKLNSLKTCSNTKIFVVEYERIEIFFSRDPKMLCLFLFVKPKFPIKLLRFGLVMKCDSLEETYVRWLEKDKIGRIWMDQGWNIF